jgi:hypothetical protein
LQGRAGVHALATAAEALPVGDGELEAMADGPALALLVEPAGEGGPAAEQGLVGDLEDGLVGDLAGDDEARADDAWRAAASAAAEPATSSSSLRRRGCRRR